MKRYAKLGYAAPFRFRVVLEKQQGGGGKMTPPTRAKVNPRPAGPLDFPPPAGGGGGV